MSERVGGRKGGWKRARVCESKRELEREKRVNAVSE
jgi:hypothetical protein